MTSTESVDALLTPLPAEPTNIHLLFQLRIICARILYRQRKSSLFLAFNVDLNLINVLHNLYDTKQGLNKDLQTLCPQGLLN